MVYLFKALGVELALGPLVSMTDSDVIITSAMSSSSLAEAPRPPCCLVFTDTVVVGVFDVDVGATVVTLVTAAMVAVVNVVTSVIAVTAVVKEGVVGDFGADDLADWPRRCWFALFLLWLCCPRGGLVSAGLFSNSFSDSMSSPFTSRTAF